MVSKKIINEIISKSIEIKSHITRVGTFNTLNNNIKSKLKDFRNKTEKLDYETMEFINSKGEIVFTKDSEKTETYQIQYTKEEMEKLGNQGEYDLIIEHNHPGAYADLIGNDVIYHKDTIPTILSKGDVMTLWNKGTAYIEETNDVLNVTPFKGIVAECPNGSRMSLIRKEDGENNVVMNDKNAEAQLKFEKTYDILHNKWNHFLEDYEMETKVHMKKWAEEHDDTEKKGGWVSDEYLDEVHRFALEFSKERFDDKYLQDVIKDFDDLGFELSVEWRNEYYDKH